MHADGGLCVHRILRAAERGGRAPARARVTDPESPSPQPEVSSDRHRHERGGVSGEQSDIRCGEDRVTTQRRRGATRPRRGRRPIGVDEPARLIDGQHVQTLSAWRSSDPGKGVEEQVASHPYRVTPPAVYRATSGPELLSGRGPDHVEVQGRRRGGRKAVGQSGGGDKGNVPQGTYRLPLTSVEHRRTQLVNTKHDNHLNGACADHRHDRAARMDLQTRGNRHIHGPRAWHRQAHGQPPAARLSPAAAGRERGVEILDLRHPSRRASGRHREPRRRPRVGGVANE